MNTTHHDPYLVVCMVQRCHSTRIAIVEMRTTGHKHLHANSVIPRTVALQDLYGNSVIPRTVALQDLYGNSDIP